MSAGQKNADPWRLVCPNCGSCSIRVKANSAYGQREHEEDYHCQRCQTHFDEPLDKKQEAAR